MTQAFAINRRLVCTRAGKVAVSTSRFAQLIALFTEVFSLLLLQRAWQCLLGCRVTGQWLGNNYGQGSAERGALALVVPTMQSGLIEVFWPLQGHEQ